MLKSGSVLAVMESEESNVAPVPTEAATSGRVLIIDSRGDLYAQLRRLQLQLALWRLSDQPAIPPRPQIDLLIFAEYQPVSWERVSQASSRVPTLIVTRSYDRSEASEALRRDLVGYVDATLAPHAFDRAIRAALRGNAERRSGGTAAPDEGLAAP
jgi:DNA-binding NarL/FixJ family response regulator